MRRSSLVVVVVAFGACSSSHGSAPDAPTMGSDASGSGSAGSDATGSGSGGSDAVCTRPTEAATVETPSILLMLSRDQAMATNLPDGVSTRAALAAQAISHYLDTERDALPFGLAFAPAPGASPSCATDYGTPQVAVAPLSTSRTPIECWLGTQTGVACGAIVAPGTTATTTNPLAIAITGGIAAARATAATGPRALVMIDDTEPNACGTIDDTIAAAADAQAPGSTPVEVFVISIGDMATANASRIAEAGGGKASHGCIGNTSMPGSACNYTVGNASYKTTLELTFPDLVKKVGCTFRPATAAPLPDDIEVTLSTGLFDGMLFRDSLHQSGWDFSDGGTTITIYGPECTSVASDPTDAQMTIALPCP